MLLTSCIGDLDTLPLNPSDSTSETVYGKDENGYLAGLTKLYFNFVSNDTTDLQVSDGGASELIRAFWTIRRLRPTPQMRLGERRLGTRHEYRHVVRRRQRRDLRRLRTYVAGHRLRERVPAPDRLGQTLRPRREQRTGRQDPELPRRGPFPARLFLLDRPRRVRRRAVHDRDLALRRRCEPQTGLAQGCLRLLHLGADRPGFGRKRDACPHARTTRVPTRVRSTACWPACTSMPRFMPAPRCGRRPNPPAKRSSAWATRSARSIPTSSAATTARTPTP